MRGGAGTQIAAAVALSFALAGGGARAQSVATSAAPGASAVSTGIATTTAIAGAPREATAAAATSATTTSASSAASSTTSAAPAAASPASEWAEVPLDELRQTEVLVRRVALPGNTYRSGYAATIVHRPVADVTAVLHDVNRYREYLPRFVQSQQLRRSGATQELFVRMALLDNLAFLWARVLYTERALPGGAVAIEGHALQGNVAQMQVRWRATPVENGASTALEFWSLVVPSLPIPLPAALIEREQERAAGQAVRAMRARIEGHAPALSNL